MASGFSRTAIGRVPFVSAAPHMRDRATSTFFQRKSRTFDSRGGRTDRRTAEASGAHGRGLIPHGPGMSADWMASTIDQLIYENTWVHLSVDPQMGGEVLTANFGASGRTSYIPGIQA